VQDLQAVIGTAVHGADEPRRSVVIAANGKRILATGRQGKQPVAGRGWPGGELVIGSFRSPANQAAQVSLVSGDATDHEDSVLSVDVDDVDAAYALARATGLLPDYDRCQAYIAKRAPRLPIRS
jgi:hypothetical protein